MAEIKIADICRMAAEFDKHDRKMIPLAEWLGREPTDADKVEVLRLERSSDAEYAAGLMAMKANRQSDAGELRGIIERAILDG